MDSRIYDITRCQYGLIARRQLLDLGLTDRQVDHFLQWGHLIRVHRGVYALPGVPVTWHQRLLAATLALGNGAAVSHRAAAALWRIDGTGRDLVEVSGELLQQTRPGHVITHRSTDLGPAYVTKHLGIPVTRPARTLLDLGAVSSQAIVDRAVDDALARGCVEWDELLDVLNALGRRGRRGTGRLRRSLAERTGVPSTVLEAEFQRLVARHGLPEPMYQYEIRDEHGVFVAKVDAVYLDVRIVIELDGASTRVGRNALLYDITRQNRIVQCGFLPLRYAWRCLVGTPQHTAREILRLREQRARELGVATAA